MRCARQLQFLTFVLIASCAAAIVAQTAFAAKSAPSPDFQDQGEAIDDKKTTDPTITDMVQITPAPADPNPEKKKLREYFYSYRHALTFRFGVAQGNGDYKHDAASIFAGTQYHFQPSDKPNERFSYEAGADLMQNGDGVLHLARREVYSRSELRPFLKAGLGLRVIPSQQLVTFLKLQNYQLRGAAGFEYMIREAESLRLEFEAALSTAGFQGLFSFGYVVAW